MKLKSIFPIGLASALTLAPFPSNGESRGLRNNNPGNIKKNSIEWNGAVGNDGIFVTFQNPEDGIRAMVRILKVYDSKYKINTVSGIVSRWAPSSENQTSKYIDFVAKEIGKNINEPIDISNNQELAKLIKAIIHFENGSVPYDDETIMRGIKKA